MQIKSNRPELYLVKPMSGSIYKQESEKIVFKRKQLPLDSFESYLRNPATLQEKFQIEFSCLERDLLGTDKRVTQVVNLVVRFNLEQRLSESSSTVVAPAVLHLSR